MDNVNNSVNTIELTNNIILWKLLSLIIKNLIDVNIEEVNDNTR